MKLKFYGHSDDLFEAEINGEPVAEIDCYRAVAAYKVADDSGALIVAGIYSPGDMRTGTWLVGVAPLDEDVPLPSWPIEVGSDRYTTTLTIEAPDTANILILRSGANWEPIERGGK